MKKFAYIQTVEGETYCPDIFDTQDIAEAHMVVDFFDHADLAGLSRHCYSENGNNININVEAAHKMYQAYMGLHLNDDIARIRLGLMPMANATNEEGCEWKGIIYSIEV